MRTRLRNVALGALLGDCIGAAVEGHNPESILKEYPMGLDVLVPSSHMGLERLPPRYGMYTDDTMAAAALMEGMLEGGDLNPQRCAYRHARAWNDGLSGSVPLRGLPNSAQRTLIEILTLKPPQHCSTLIFPDGSFANGAAMKVYPVALAFRNATPEELRTAVEASCMYTHSHPDAIDAAHVLAYCIQQCLHLTTTFNPIQMTQQCLQQSKSPTLQRYLTKLLEVVKVPDADRQPFDVLVKQDVAIMRSILDTREAGFQISGCGAVFCVFLILCQHCWPNETNVNDLYMTCIRHAIGLGGDTDTIASMVGACVGALSPANDAWYPTDILSELEPLAHKVLEMAESISDRLDLRSVVVTTPSFVPTARDNALVAINDFNFYYTERHMRETLDLPGFVKKVFDTLDADKKQ
eukprot:PhF_6_TR40479/c0_g1_i3/m.60523/K11687/ADPRHL2; poly(ADP-ribose) glycohydrolase ARH3